jgi:hypothetical protein
MALRGQNLFSRPYFFSKTIRTILLVFVGLLLICVDETLSL